MGEGEGSLGVVRCVGVLRLYLGLAKTILYVRYVYENFWQEFHQICSYTITLEGKTIQVVISEARQ